MEELKGENVTKRGGGSYYAIYFGSKESLEIGHGIDD
jgi:hypothetical protein